MTVIKHRSAGVAVPLGGGRPVALAILCAVLFLTFLDNTIVSVGLGSVQADLHAGLRAGYLRRRRRRPLRLSRLPLSADIAVTRSRWAEQMTSRACSRSPGMS